LGDSNTVELEISAVGIPYKRTLCMSWCVLVAYCCFYIADFVRYWSGAYL